MDSEEEEEIGDEDEDENKEDGKTGYVPLETSTMSKNSPVQIFRGNAAARPIVGLVMIDLRYTFFGTLPTSNPNQSYIQLNFF